MTDEELAAIEERAKAAPPGHEAIHPDDLPGRSIVACGRECRPPYDYTVVGVEGPARVAETLAEDGNAMLGRALAHAETFQRERDEARVEVERLLTENERLRARVEALASDLYVRFGAAGPRDRSRPR